MFNLPLFFQGQNTYLWYQIKCLHTRHFYPSYSFLLLLLISNYLFKISTWHFLSYNNFSLTSVHYSFIYFLQASATRKDFSFSPNRKTNTAFKFSVMFCIGRLRLQGSCQDKSSCSVSCETNKVCCPGVFPISLPHTPAITAAFLMSSVISLSVIPSVLFPDP